MKDKPTDDSLSRLIYRPRIPKPDDITFNIGDSVKMSKSGLNAGINISNKERCGRIMGYSGTAGCVWVLWDGLKRNSRVCYHVDFLRKCSNAK